MLNRDYVTEKWKPILEHQNFDPISDRYKEQVTAVLLENQTNYLRELNNTEATFASGSQSLLTEAPTNVSGTGGYTAAATATGPVAGYDPVLISLVRRSTPQLMAFDICGVQPLSAPSGLIFAMRSLRGTPGAGAETFYDEVDAGFSAGSTATGSNPALLNVLPDGLDGVGGNADDEAAEAGTTTADSSIYDAPPGYPTATAEDLGDGTAFNEMSISIEKLTVEAKSRALKAEYSLEMAQDLKAVHGLNAESELSSILSTEIMAELNREVIRTLYGVAKPGAAFTTTPGVYDLDADSSGRWAVENFKGLHFQIERDCNAVGHETRRGKANFIICSADVASALAMTGILDYGTNRKFQGSTLPDDTQSTLAGTINGRLKVYVDPYAANVSQSQYYVVGYKGSSAYDAGIFYCPYIPLQKVRAVDPNTFAPKIGFKMRYGMIANPFAEGATKGSGALNLNSNVYYRRVRVNNLYA